MAEIIVFLLSLMSSTAEIPTTAASAPVLTSAGIDVVVSDETPWESLKKEYAKISRKPALVLFVTEEFYLAREKRKILPKILSGLKRYEDDGYQFIIRCGATIGATLRTINVPDDEVSVIVISPHAKDVDGLVSDVKKRWNATISKAGMGIGTSKNYVVIDVGQCSCRRGKTCERCNGAIVKKMLGLS